MRTNFALARALLLLISLTIVGQTDGPRSVAGEEPTATCTQVVGFSQTNQ
jgi:hypothetical protein